MKNLLKRALVAAALSASAVVANSAVIYSFDSTAVTGFGAGPYGTVTLSDMGTDISINVSLRSDMNFVNTGNKSVFSFNVKDASATDVTNVLFNGAANTNYTVVSPGVNPPFGTSFTLMIDCTAGRPNCTNGAPGQIQDPLTFLVKNAEYTDFGFFATGTTAYFAADVICTSETKTAICDPAANTGAIGVTKPGDDGSPPPTNLVPEPGSLALVALALLGAGWAGRRKA